MNKVVDRKDAHLADVLPHLEAILGFLEISGQAVHGNLFANIFLINALPGEIDRLGIDVRGEYLDRMRLPGPAHMFLDENGERVGFLARRAPCHPDTQRAAGFDLLEDFWQDLALEELEYFPVAEKLRDPDDEIFEELFRFARILSEHIGIGRHGIDAQHLHASANAADERGLLVAAEIMPERFVQDAEDRRKSRGDFVLPALAVGVLRAEGEIAEELPAHFLGWKAVVRHACDDCGARHRVEAGGLRCLGDRKATEFSNCLQPHRAVISSAREDDSHGVFLKIEGQ